MRTVMRWGEYGGYQWLVALSLPLLVEATVEFHRGLRLCITAYDSGPLHPSPEERAEGWMERGDVMVSPALSEEVHVPTEQFDEWYLFADPPPPDWQPEIFVNYGGFTLLPPGELYLNSDPTWDRSGLDGLISLQERFWAQLERVRPVSYLAMGDCEVIVSRCHEFIDHLRSDAERVARQPRW